jgi:hypothetical protein
MNNHTPATFVSVHTVKNPGNKRKSDRVLCEGGKLLVDESYFRSGGIYWAVVEVGKPRIEVLFEPYLICFMTRSDFTRVKLEHKKSNISPAVRDTEPLHVTEVVEDSDDLLGDRPAKSFAIFRTQLE